MKRTPWPHHVAALLCFGALLGPATALASGSSAPQPPTPFSFIAFGDMPYGQSAEVYQRYTELLQVIDAQNPAFSVHVGDIKSGSTPCSDELLRQVRDSFQTLKHPLIYTPGDNEWTDCHREKAGRYDPLERLAFLRREFFGAGGQSLGAAPMPLTSQTDLPENTRWQRGGVTFATLHVVGSNNGLERNAQMAGEYFTRNAANLAWLKGTFAQARESGSAGVVLVMQADMFEQPGLSGFADMLSALKAEAAAFAGPVLLVHGDSHVLKFDQPFNTYDDSSAPNIFRLEVPGDQRMQAVQVTVDAARPEVFSFRVLGTPN
ncbi:hypothetical protein [Deinococcus radiophilus]|uniref:hypothetical protein n=1 Tax=Deinococcus radiophilus TaxID=32062 RepID=UPI001E61D2D0|nr:hypothetical protein [Deinococcus radiophilus]UFA51014.1 hypothetical protein LMT64_03700 [Deinococcus radiophilus]